MLLSFRIFIQLYGCLIAFANAYEQLPVVSVQDWSTGSGQLSNIIDGDLTTQWGSIACRSTGWRGNRMFNRLYEACETGVCSASCSGNLADATDNNPYTAGRAELSHAEGRSWALLPFPAGDARAARQVYLRGNWPVNTSAWATVADGEPILLGTLGPEQKYADIVFTPPAVPITGLKLQSVTRDGLMRGYCYAGVGDCKTLVITEAAVQTEDCFEQITLDLGASKEVSVLSLKFSAIYAGMMATSVDGLTFVDRLDLKSFPFSYSSPMVVDIQNVTARYLRFRFYTDPAPSRVHDKVYVQEISVFGTNAPSACPNDCSGATCVDDICSCPPGYTGDDCSIPVCNPVCGSGGACVDGMCECNDGYRGDTCESALCANDCWKQGVCVSGTCVCNEGYTGDDCRYEVFDSVNNGVQTSVKTLDYRTILGSSEFPYTLPPAVSVHNSLSDECTAELPFLCADNSCAISRGACALRSKTETTTWLAEDFEAAMIPATAFFTSSNSGQASNIGDGAQKTSWQSGFCYPSGYVVVSELNVLSTRCANVPSACTFSGTTAADVPKATDTNFNTAVSVPLQSALAWFEVQLQAPSALAAVTAKVSVGTGATVNVFGISSAGAKVALGSISSSYALSNFLVSSSSAFVSIRLESSAAFNLFEISARSSTCFEYAGVDFGSAVPITALTIRHYAGGSASNLLETLYESSVDGVHWAAIEAAGTDIPPLLTSALDVHIDPALMARYVRVRHVLQEGVAAKVYVWEISAWGMDGKYGVLPPASANPITFRELLGVNGIWAFENQGWSNLVHDGWGARRYSGIATHGRNYHNWNWDVKDPDTVPDYEKMACGDGTNSFWWLSWDWEYAGWNAAGLEVECSIQFDSISKSSFNDPEGAGYNFGYTFAKHFGRNGGTSLVRAMEIGNEPWSFDAEFYSSLLNASARGAKDADPSMLVLPGAFSSLKEYLDRVGPDVTSLLDAINVHAYSWIQTARGRTGIHPEHKMSTLHAVNSYIRFRDDKAPGLPIYLTEWGWDAAGGGETCSPPADREGESDFPECVTEAAQAAYAVRGALVLARKGLSRLTWFFYGNTIQTGSSWDKGHGVFSRSGLVSSSAAGYQDKQSLYALEGFVSILGDTRFLSVINEDDNSYVYALGNDDGVSHIVAWLPIDANTSTSSDVTFTVTFGDAPRKAWQLGSAVLSEVALPSTIGNQWTMVLSAFPVVITL